MNTNEDRVTVAAPSTPAELEAWSRSPSARHIRYTQISSVLEQFVLAYYKLRDRLKRESVELWEDSSFAKCVDDAVAVLCDLDARSLEALAAMGHSQDRTPETPTECHKRLAREAEVDAVRRRYKRSVEGEKALEDAFQRHLAAKESGAQVYETVIPRF